LLYREVKNPVNFPELENEVLEFWEKNGIFKKSITTRDENRRFTFYEGPPTANGKPGIHHVISRIMKDSICRYRTMQGYRVERKAGWDTHGLPVEIEVEKELGFRSKEDIEAYGVDRFNRKCRESVFKYLKEWNELTRRIGFWVDIENPYITYTSEYIETVWYLLAEMWRKGFLYQGFKILPYCPRCETPLSSHETSLGYRDITERAITVKFRLVEDEKKFILAWTTTPWTLPGNVALAVGKDILYAEVEQEVSGNKEIYYIAENRLDVLKGEYRIIRKLRGKEMEGWKYRPLFDFVNLAGDGSAYYVAVADFVTTDEGTGVVHTAVMYGEDDYRLGMEIGLPAHHTVDEHGCFNDSVPRWKGRYVKDEDVEHEIVEYLRDSGLLYSEEQYTHSYPHCWRCDAQLIYYAKKSWYLRTTKIRDMLIENNKKIEWFPREVGEGRFGQWIENNVDWALSRDRYWGTPLNVWICDGCSRELAVESIEKLKSLSGLDRIDDLHKPYIDEVKFSCCECGGTMRRTPEVIDCWFDSGAMPYAQFHYPFEKNGNFEKNFPADFIAEGVDQTRGWFYSLLAISTMISNQSSYRSCLSIELILDKDGQKMSKSRGNTVDPFLILREFGADPLRWYLFVVSPPWVPTRFDTEGVREVVRKFFGTLSNIYSFFVMYANIDNFEYDKTAIAVKERPEIDRWLISTLNSLVRQINTYMKRYEVTKVTRAIQNFVIDDLSNWYIRRNRRRFWKSEIGDDKLSAYCTLYETLVTTAKLIAPFAPFMAEDIYRNLTKGSSIGVESVHLERYPDPGDEHYRYIDDQLEQMMKSARDVVILCRAARNEAGIKVRQPLKRVIIAAQGEISKKAIGHLEELIKEEVNVRKIEISDDPSLFMVKKAKPVFRNLGPKFGEKVNDAAEAIRSFGEREIESIEKGRSIEITIGNGEKKKVEPQDVEIVSEPVEGVVIQSDQNITVGLDTTLDDDLIAEGMARELVNRVQNMRKEAGFEVTDRIMLFFEAAPIIKKSIELKGDYIKKETLCTLLVDDFKKGEFNKDFVIDGEKVRIGIERTNSQKRGDRE